MSALRPAVAIGERFHELALSPHSAYFRMSKTQLDQPPNAHQGLFAAICGLGSVSDFDRFRTLLRLFDSMWRHGDEEADSTRSWSKTA